MPITYQVYSLSQYFILPITFQFPTIFKDNIPHIHLTFFQKLRKCVNWIVTSPLSPFAFVAVKGVAVVVYLRDTSFFLFFLFFLFFCFCIFFVFCYFSKNKIFFFFFKFFLFFSELYILYSYLIIIKFS